MAGHGARLDGGGSSFPERDSALRSVHPRHYGWSLSSELSGDPASCAFTTIRIVCSRRWTALQIALTESLISRGVLPDALDRCRMGEAAA